MGCFVEYEYSWKEEIAAECWMHISLAMEGLCRHILWSSAKVLTPDFHLPCSVMCHIVVCMMLPSACLLGSNHAVAWMKTKPSGESAGFYMRLSD
eukprot:5398412-Amphidinium_carterae.1